MYRLWWWIWKKLEEEIWNESSNDENSKDNVKNDEIKSDMKPRKQIKPPDRFDDEFV